MSLDSLSDEMVQQMAAAIPKALTALLVIGKKWLNARDLVNRAKEYRVRMEADCSRMQILGMEQPIPLDHIYTEVRIVNRVRARMFRTIAELEDESRKAVEKRSLIAIEDCSFANSANSTLKTVAKTTT